MPACSTNQAIHGEAMTGEYDLTTPNPVYFAHVDNVVTWAGTNGIQRMLDTLETGDWTSVPSPTAQRAAGSGASSRRSL